MSQLFPFAALASLPEPVLSVYLDVHPVRHLNRNSSHGYFGWFANQARQLLATRDSSEQSSLTTEINRIAKFLEENPPEVRGIALFAGPGVWHALHMPVEPENELHWGKPMLWQLFAMAHRHRPSCIATVDHSGVRLFSSQFGELTPLDALDFHIDPSHWKRMQAFHAAEKKAGMPHGPQRDLFERRRETNYSRFLADAAHRMSHLCRIHGLNEALLLGPIRYTAIMEHKLPASLREQTIQIPHLWSKWNSSVLQSDVDEVLCRFEAARQERHLGELLNRGPAVVSGVEETLALLQRGRLGLLIAEAGFNPMLRYCATCHHASASSAQECPRCRGGLADLTLHQILPQLLIRCCCHSEFLSGRSAELLRAVGGIGGFLRKRPRLSISEQSLRQHPTAWQVAGMA